MGELLNFCNPVEKRHLGTTTITNPDAHYKVYDIIDLSVPPLPPRPRTVTVSNQFGTTTLFAVLPIALVVPTQKVSVNGTSTGLGFPTGVDHFKCWGIPDPLDFPGFGFPPRPNPGVFVDLTDQFHTEPNVLVGDVLVFCNPVVKTRLDLPVTDPGYVTPILNPLDHLVCYLISGAPFPTVLSTHNQFFPLGGPPEIVGVTDPALLCVPTKKLSSVPGF